ncbi:MAG: hypothetical protein ABSB60_18035 [Terracidiphilus sp.]
MKAEVHDKAPLQRVRSLIRKIVFGETLLPQEFTIGMIDPQAEISVWLHGMGDPIDVTNRMSTACAAPFIICIAVDETRVPDKQKLSGLSLRFCERRGCKRLLGKIGLQFRSEGEIGKLNLIFFTPRSAANYCLPRARLWAHYLWRLYQKWRFVNTTNVKMSFLEYRAAWVTYIRPHPKGLMSANGELAANIFPVLMTGEIGQGRFGFGLNAEWATARLVENTRKVALCSVPTRYAPLVYQFAAHHYKDSIAWNQISLSLVRSRTLGIPIPDFALRVREMEVERIYNFGSHVFFVARVLSDEAAAHDEELCVIHGMYQAWRLKGNSSRLKASLERHLLQRNGPIPPCNDNVPSGSQPA